MYSTTIYFFTYTLVESGFAVTRYLTSCGCGQQWFMYIIGGLGCFDTFSGWYGISGTVVT